MANESVCSYLGNKEVSMEKESSSFKLNVTIGLKKIVIVSSILLTVININFDYTHFRDSSKGDFQCPTLMSYLA